MPRRVKKKGKAKKAPTPDLSHIIEPLRGLAVVVESVSHDPANARKHPDENIEAIKASLAEYGQRKPIVVNYRTGTIEAGNGTLTAAQALGWSHIACVFVDDDVSKAAGYSVSDNRSGELAGWDAAALEASLRVMQTGNEELAASWAALAESQGIIPAKPADAAPKQKEQIKCPACGHEF